jgi:hypothetical protein
VRSNPQKLATMVTGSSSRLLVYGTDTSTSVAARPVAFPDLRFVPLTEEEVRALTDPPGEEGFSGRQAARLDRLGKSYAWAVYVEGNLAHISWLLPADAVARDIPAVLALEADEAEITGCETLGAFQGKGIYGFAIQQLVAAARAQGVRRIYMKTSEANAASQKGILKAGLRHIGRIRMSHPPLQPSRTIVRREIAW